MSDSNQHAEGKPPPIDTEKIGVNSQLATRDPIDKLTSSQKQMPPEAIAARETDLEHIDIDIAAEKEKHRETTPVPQPINEEVIKHIFGNLASVHDYQHIEAAIKGQKITVPQPRLEELLPKRQQYPMDPPPNVTSVSGDVGASGGKGKGEAVDDEKR